MSKAQDNFAKNVSTAFREATRVPELEERIAELRGLIVEMCDQRIRLTSFVDMKSLVESPHPNVAKDAQSLWNRIVSAVLGESEKT